MDGKKGKVDCRSVHDVFLVVRLLLLPVQCEANKRAFVISSRNYI